MTCIVCIEIPHDSGNRSLCYQCSESDPGNLDDLIVETSNSRHRECAPKVPQVCSARVWCSPVRSTSRRKLIPTYLVQTGLCQYFRSLCMFTNKAGKCVSFVGRMVIEDANQKEWKRKPIKAERNLKLRFRGNGWAAYWNAMSLRQCHGGK